MIQKVSNFEVVTKEDIKEYNPNFNPSRYWKLEALELEKQIYYLI